MGGVSIPFLMISSVVEEHGHRERPVKMPRFILQFYPSLFYYYLDTFPNMLHYATATAQNHIFILSLICFCLLLIIKRQ